MLRRAAWCCAGLHGAAQGCVMLRRIAWCFPGYVVVHVSSVC